MKLKKIASLALAGIMAVSMLAGCNKGGNDNGSSSSEVTVTTGIVDTLNNNQNKNNDVKVEFTSNSALDTALSAAVKDSAATVTVANLARRMYSYNPINAWNPSSASASYNFYNDDNIVAFTSAGVSNEKVNPVTLVKCYIVTSAQAWNEANAIKLAVAQMDEDIATLTADDVDADQKVNGKPLTTANNKYHEYDYAGNVSMVSEDNGDGTTTYYFAMAITQTVTQVEYKG